MGANGNTATKGPKGPIVTVEKVGPNEAAEMLGRNFRNRHIRTRLVDRYVREIKRNEWLLGGEPIELTADGTLLNGQHRLQAIIEANKAIELIVMRNAPPKLQNVADSGSARSFKDVLRIKGVTSAPAKAAATRAILQFESTREVGVRTTGVYGNPELLKFFERHREAIEEAFSISEGLRQSIAPPIRPAVLTTLVYEFVNVDPEEAEGFFDRLRNPVELAEDDPIYALRRTLDRYRHAHTGEWDARRSGSRVAAALTIKAFNYWREGRRIEVVSFKAGGRSPEAFPEILPADAFATASVA